MAKRITIGLVTRNLPPFVMAGITKRNRFFIEMALVKHLLKITSYKEFSDELKPLIKVCYIKALRNAMLSNFKYVVRLKHALLRVLRERTPTEQQADVFADFNLSDHSRLVRGLRQQKVFTKGHKIARSAKITIQSEADVRKQCAEMLLSIKKYVTGFAYRKLTFVATSNKMKIEDLIADLYEKAITAFYSLIPFLVPAHVTNSVLRAVHNEGINIIKYYTAGKRARLTSDGQGSFQNTQISLTVGDEGEENEDAPGIIVYSSTRPFRELEARLTFQDLIARHGQMPRKLAVLKLLGMQPDPSFTAYAVAQHNVRRGSSTEEIFDTIGPQKFVESIQDHLKIDPAHFAQFMQVLRESV